MVRGEGAHREYQTKEDMKLKEEENRNILCSTEILNGIAFS